MASSDFIQRSPRSAGTSSTSPNPSARRAEPSEDSPGGSTTIRDRSPGSAYALLSRQVRSAGLLRHRPLSSVTALAVTLLLLAGGWAAFLLIGDSWWQLTVAAVLAFAFTQCGFRGHEAGHRQLFHGKRANDATGLVFGNLFIGLGFGWWVAKHNRHHAHPNQVGRDPDIETGAVVFIDHEARGRTGVTGFITRHQASLFFPMLLLEGWALHVATFRALRRGRTSAPAPLAVEALALLVHVAAYLTVVLMVLSPLKALVFVVVQQALFGLYMGVSFAPNHKGMAMPGEHDRPDFLRGQVLTSRNVRGGRVIDFVLGGLNYQIEHHLFPSMPRTALPAAQPLIRAYCAELDLPYAQTGLVDSYRQALRHLHAVGAPLRAERRA
ncbi:MULTISPECIES: fatty acid desaturase family protein [Streptomyces]|uniref:fatty acid desaturase family protein n=1 Tax=Streptomyces malaysiensis TaxID=92644 RepID=UPI000C99EBB2|nr:MULTISPECIES: acyl-CoA desaturase [Streptomyces]WHX19647.1 acyl-CoA desaturase [Streptomyces sp. NA07423]